jgi:hypothetical protein
MWRQDLRGELEKYFYANAIADRLARDLEPAGLSKARIERQRHRGSSGVPSLCVSASISAYCTHITESFLALVNV